MPAVQLRFEPALSRAVNLGELIDDERDSGFDVTR
jgi:hypothetical protein